MLLHRMRVLLKLMMVLAIVVGNGSSVAAAICQHRNASEHALARASRDAKVAAAALTEETAASVNAKKGSPGNSNSTAPSDMLAPASLMIPPRSLEPLRLRARDAPILAGTSLPPLLRPPLA
jgi:hypothetical protein